MKLKSVVRGLKQLVGVTLGEIRLPESKNYGDTLPSARYSKGTYEDFNEFLSGDSHRRGLDLGCGVAPKNPFGIEEMTGIDIVGSQSTGVIQCDLSRGEVPVKSRSYDFVSAYDFLEHVPRWAPGEKLPRFPFIELMNEIDRSLRIGGLFFSLTPAFPSSKAFQDPTHVNIITEDTFPIYFCGKDPEARMYGFIGQFELVKQVWSGGHLLTMLRKI